MPEQGIIAYASSTCVIFLLQKYFSSAGNDLWSCLGNCKTFCSPQLAEELHLYWISMALTLFPLDLLQDPITEIPSKAWLKSALCKEYQMKKGGTKMATSF